ncbi:MAG: response regulator [Fibrobacteres bacterium]|jgi:signal transduction histidine kinase/CheY-like chemotaxis protein|nr:response regulator [Fibrobacterota bacterium]
MISCKDPISWCFAAPVAICAAAVFALDGIHFEIALRSLCAFTGVLASVILWRAGSKCEKTESIAFRILSIGMTAWTIGIGTHLVDLFQGRLKLLYPPADLCFLVAAVCSVVGMAKLPTARPLPKARRVLLLDQAIAAISSGVVFWHLVLVPNLGEWEHHSPARLALTLLYPIVEFVILQMAVDLVVRGPSREELRPVYRMAALGFLSLLAGSVLAGLDFWQQKGWERQLLHLTNLGFALAMLRGSRGVGDRQTADPGPPSRWLALRESLVPLAWVAMPSFAFAWILLVGGVGAAWDLLLAMGVLATLVIVRQRVAQRRLAADLRSALLASLLPAILGFQLLAMVSVCLVLSVTFQKLASDSVLRMATGLSQSLDMSWNATDDSGSTADGAADWKILPRARAPGILADAISARANGVTTHPREGSLSPTLYAWASLPSRPGSVLVLIAPLAAYMDVARNAGSVIMFLFLCAAGITVWMISIKARNLSEPLEALTRAASQVQKGDLSVRAGVRGIDEVGRLGDAMDSMVERLTQMLQEQRELAEKAREASLAKTRFLANMSHEIRTPLNGVLGLAELLDSGELQPAERELVGDLRSSARNLRDLVGDILDLSKIEAERISIEFLDFRPAELVDQVGALFLPTARAKGLVLDCRWESPLDAKTTGDPARLRQILSNLASNAIKFTGEGTVSLRGRIVDEKPPRLVFEVEDSGPGIAAPSHDKIWHDFVQADESTTRRFGGTGLGLPISRSLARLMGGDLTLARSAPGVGSLFVLDIPISQPTSSAGPDPVQRPEPEERLDGLRVLVAEDNSINQKVIVGFLRRLGCSPQVVEDGIAAVSAAMETRPDLILMDVHMPRMDGLVAASKLRESGYEGRIWALTASALDAEYDRCIEAGMDGFLAKPIGLADLRAMLAKEFGSRV